MKTRLLVLSLLLAVLPPLAGLDLSLESAEDGRRLVLLLSNLPLEEIRESLDRGFRSELALEMSLRETAPPWEFWRPRLAQQQHRLVLGYNRLERRFFLEQENRTDTYLSFQELIGALAGLSWTPVLTWASQTYIYEARVIVWPVKLASPLGWLQYLGGGAGLSSPLRSLSVRGKP